MRQIDDRVARVERALLNHGRAVMERNRLTDRPRKREERARHGSERLALTLEEVVNNRARDPSDRDTREAEQAEEEEFKRHKHEPSLARLRAR
ncbi:hypothetical protein GCM10020360_07130 [Nonlabens tegetincola]